MELQLDGINVPFDDFADQTNHPFRSVDGDVPLTDAATHANVMRMVVEADESLPHPTAREETNDESVEEEGSQIAHKIKKRKKMSGKCCSNCRKHESICLCPYCGPNVHLCSSCDSIIHAMKVFSGHVRHDASLKCSNCSVMKAVVRCTKCGVMLCGACDNFVHSLNLFHHHERVAATTDEAFVPPTNAPKPHPMLTQSKKVPKRGRPRKQFGAPKAAMTAYMYFSQERRDMADGKSFSEMGKILGHKWKTELTPEEKQKYYDMAYEDKIRYEKQMKQFRAGQALDGPTHFRYDGD